MDLKSSHKDRRVTVILLEKDKDKLYEVLDGLGITRAEGIREILIAFSQGRCAIEPRVDSMSKLFKKRR